MIISAAKALEAAEVLGVKLEALTSSALGKAYRAKTKDCHPDHHGSKELQLWARVSWANECLKHWLKQNPENHEPPVPEGHCRACKGTGRVTVATKRLGEKLTMQCIICEGKGTVELKEDDGD